MPSGQYSVNPMAKPKQSSGKSPNEEFDIAEGVRVGKSPTPGITLQRIVRSRIVGKDLSGNAPEERHSINRFAWALNGRHLAAACRDSTIQIWDTKTGETLKILAGHKGRVDNVAWSPDSRLIASTSAV